MLNDLYFDRLNWRTQTTMAFSRHTSILVFLLFMARILRERCSGVCTSILLKIQKQIIRNVSRS